MLSPITTSSTDALKLVLIVAVGAGLLALGRWSSRLGGSGSRESPGDSPNPDPKELLPDYGSPPQIWPPSGEEVAASLPFDPSLGKLRITKFFFEKTDAATGPADPEEFTDELHVQLYDPDTGHDWWQSHLVATPRGLAKVLREKSWRYLYAPDILVLPRYDLEEIRRAAVSRIVADHEYFKDQEQPEEETL